MMLPVYVLLYFSLWHARTTLWIRCTTTATTKRRLCSTTSSSWVLSSCLSTSVQSTNIEKMPISYNHLTFFYDSSCNINLSISHVCKYILCAFLMVFLFFYQISPILCMYITLSKMDAIPISMYTTHIHLFNRD